MDSLLDAIKLIEDEVQFRKDNYILIGQEMDKIHEMEEIVDKLIDIAEVRGY